MGRINFNADENTIKKLDELCQKTERNRTQMIIFLIKEKHDKEFGD
jgi:predicted transcriptional regulator